MDYWCMMVCILCVLYMVGCSYTATKTLDQKQKLSQGQPRSITQRRHTTHSDKAHSSTDQQWSTVPHTHTKNKKATNDNNGVCARARVSHVCFLILTCLFGLLIGAGILPWFLL